MSNRPAITRWEMVKLIVVLNLIRLLVPVENAAYKALSALEKFGWEKIKNDVLVPVGLLAFLLVSIYIANDCSYKFPHFVP